METKRTFSLFILIIIFSYSNAQVKWNLIAGFTSSNITVKDAEGNKTNTKSTPGIYLGIGTTIPLINNLSLEPSLVYAKRGFKQDIINNGWVDGNDFEAKVSYFELPVDIVYHPKIGPGNLLLAAGPYIGYGSKGSWKTKGNLIVDDIVYPESNGDVVFQKENTGLGNNTYLYGKPWDYGLHFKIGYSLFDHYTISLNLQRGLANLEPKFVNYTRNQSVKNNSIGINLMYSL